MSDLKEVLTRLANDEIISDEEARDVVSAVNYSIRGSGLVFIDDSVLEWVAEDIWSTLKERVESIVDTLKDKMDDMVDDVSWKLDRDTLKEMVENNT